MNQLYQGDNLTILRNFGIKLSLMSQYRKGRIASVLVCLYTAIFALFFKRFI